MGQGLRPLRRPLGAQPRLPAHGGAVRRDKAARNAVTRHTPPTADAGHAQHSAQEMMGHGGHGGMSMDDMVSHMRNRFVVAAVLTVGIALWSPMGRDMLGFTRAGAFDCVMTSSR